MTEDIQIITGHPSYVQKRMTEYFAEHPDGQVLSSSISTTPAEGKTKASSTVLVILGRKL